MRSTSFLAVSIMHVPGAECDIASHVSCQKSASLPFIDRLPSAQISREKFKIRYEIFLIHTAKSVAQRSRGSKMLCHFSPHYECRPLTLHLQFSFFGCIKFQVIKYLLKCGCEPANLFLLFLYCGCFLFSECSFAPSETNDILMHINRNLFSGFYRPHDSPTL